MRGFNRSTGRYPWVTQICTDSILSAFTCAIGGRILPFIASKPRIAKQRRAIVNSSINFTIDIRLDLLM